MSEEQTEEQTVEATETEEAAEVEAPAPAPVVDEPKIMCYVSKRMVPKSQTVELEYAQGKKVWVLQRYIKFETGDTAAA